MYHASVGAFPFVIITDNGLYSYHRQHLTSTAAKLKNCNNLIVKLPDTSCGILVQVPSTLQLWHLLLSCRILLPIMIKIL